MEETRLFSSDICDGYFGTKRFDRNSGERIHMVSAAGLLETSHRIPNLAYHLTYSNSLGGEYATAIHGHGLNPGTKDILEVAKGIGINHNKAKIITSEIEEIVSLRLKAYL